MAAAFAETECQPSVRHKGTFKNPWPDCKFPNYKDLVKWQMFETNYSKVPSRKEVHILSAVYYSYGVKRRCNAVVRIIRHLK